MRHYRNRYYKEWEKLSGKSEQTNATELSEEIAPAEVKTQVVPQSLITQFKKRFQNVEDLSNTTFQHIQLDMYYFEYLVTKEILQDRLKEFRHVTKEEIDQYLRESSFKELPTFNEIEYSIFQGNAILFYQEQVYELPVKDGESRAVAPSETETAIVGPHDAFVESVETNLSLIRKRMNTTNLKSIKLEVGTTAKRTVFLLYVEDLVSKEDIDYITKQIKSVQNDGIVDMNMLVQLIDEHPHSPFPQYYITERPDVSVYKLFDGKIVGLLQSSPHAFCTPASFFDFLESIDDFGQRWLIGTSIKILRYIAILITLFFTPIYVSVTTFHYEMIPQPLLPTLLESRSKVPFPPIIEALFLEFLLEMLREAGARLPTKIGQTIGIVGGIVVGQAAVEAGITSNILIIVVAASAIASFVVPNYLMSASIRIVRFAFIFLAGFWGNIGIIFGFGLLVVHLTSITNLRFPYLLPVSPMYKRFWKYSIFRGPLRKKKMKKQRQMSDVK
ncbi:spore germination protein [Bacillus salitolerans]|uniref:Spore germination protein n=1 Tax=Bacillus salitolerans TaxID=1437434 RepID=A0ABW4LVA0_9BACI